MVKMKKVIRATEQQRSDAAALQVMNASMDELTNAIGAKIADKAAFTIEANVMAFQRGEMSQHTMLCRVSEACMMHDNSFKKLSALFNSIV
jgi:soluble cytochrome b562